MFPGLLVVGQCLVQDGLRLIDLPFLAQRGGQHDQAPQLPGPRPDLSHRRQPLAHPRNPLCPFPLDRQGHAAQEGAPGKVLGKAMLPRQREQLLDLFLQLLVLSPVFMNTAAVAEGKA